MKPDKNSDKALSRFGALSPLEGSDEHNSIVGACLRYGVLEPLIGTSQRETQWFYVKNVLLEQASDMH